MARESDAHRVARHAKVEWVDERPPEHKISIHLTSVLNRLRHLQKQDSKAHDWVLWSEELHRQLQEEEEEAASGEQLKRRALLHAAYDAFKEKHQELQLQLLSRQTLVVDMFYPSSSSQGSDQLVAEWTHKLQRMLKNVHAHSLLRFRKQEVAGQTWQPSSWKSFTKLWSDSEDANQQHLAPNISISQIDATRLRVYVPHAAFLAVVIDW